MTVSLELWEAIYQLNRKTRNESTLQETNSVEQTLKETTRHKNEEISEPYQTTQYKPDEGKIVTLLGDLITVVKEIQQSVDKHDDDYSREEKGQLQNRLERQRVIIETLTKSEPLYNRFLELFARVGRFKPVYSKMISDIFYDDKACCREKDRPGVSILNRLVRSGIIERALTSNGDRYYLTPFGEKIMECVFPGLAKAKISLSGREGITYKTNIKLSHEGLKLNEKILTLEGIRQKETDYMYVPGDVFIIEIIWNEDERTMRKEHTIKVGTMREGEIFHIITISPQDGQIYARNY